MIFFFWLSVFLVIYVYFGYPALLFLKSKVNAIQINKDLAGDYCPVVSIIIAAYNEEKCIGDKIENTLSLDYPKDKMEIIVASDCSDDKTDSIVLQYKEQHVILNRQKERLGKTSAQNDSVKKAKGEIIIFSDATTIYEKDSLKKMIRNFNDENVGCVGGELNYVNPTGKQVGKGGGIYWKYECAIRNLESSVCSLIGVSGCMYAVRRKFYRDIPIDVISDFVIASVLRAQDKLIVFEPEAVCYEETTKTNEDEFKMRVRVIVRSLRGIWAYRNLLNVKKYGFYAFQLWSHKVLRYLVPVFLILAFVSNLFLLGNWFYWLLFIIQVVFYALAITGYIYPEKSDNNPYIYVPLYFCLTNYAALKAILRFFLGEKDVVWVPHRE